MACSMLHRLFMLHLANDAERRRANETRGLVVSRDPELVELVERACAPAWSVEVREDWHRLEKIAGDLHVGVVIVDDDVIPEEERRRSIEDIHVWFPEGFVIYVAGTHSQAIERQARAAGVLSYTSKPVEARRLEGLLRSLSSRSLVTTPPDSFVRRGAGENR